jgi:hypothetical protein
MKNSERPRAALAWILYHAGDTVSRAMHCSRWDFGFLYPIYNRLMVWSVALDREERIWKTPEKGEEP